MEIHMDINLRRRKMLNILNYFNPNLIIFDFMTKENSNFVLMF